MKAVLLALLPLASADGYTTMDVFQMSLEMSSGFFEGYNMYQIANAVNTTYEFNSMDNSIPSNFNTQEAYNVFQNMLNMNITYQSSPCNMLQATSDDDLDMDSSAQQNIDQFEIGQQQLQVSNQNQDCPKHNKPRDTANFFENSGIYSDFKNYIQDQVNYVNEYNINAMDAWLPYQAQSQITAIPTEIPEFINSHYKEKYINYFLTNFKNFNEAMMYLDLNQASYHIGQMAWNMKQMRIDVQQGTINNNQWSKANTGGFVFNIGLNETASNETAAVANQSTPAIT